MLHARIFAAIIFMFTAVPGIFAQDDPPVSVDSAIVRLNVGVVDQRGRPITSLRASNFRLFENGDPQEISRFETSTAPFSVVVMLDMSGSTKSFRQNIKLSAARFLDALSPEDRVAIVEFYGKVGSGKIDNKVNLLANFTTNRRVAAESIALANGEGQTNLYDALAFAMDRLSRENTRRKAIVVLTDGVDTALQNDDRKRLSDLADDQVLTGLRSDQNSRFNEVLSMADRQGITIYPLALPTGDPKRLADPTPRQVAMYQAARERLQIMADRTGGTLNAINRLEEMGRLYAVVAADLRTLYTIEYSPADLKRDGKWRAIRVEVDDPGLIPRTRQGYFAR